MNDIGFGSLGSILPEIILLIGGLLILLLDMAQQDTRDSGRGYMAISIIFLVGALVGVLLERNAEPQTALAMVEIDPFAMFLKITILTAMTLVAVAGGSYMNKRALGRGEFWSLFLFVTLAMSMAVGANNLLLLFLSIEFLSITSYILVGFLREDTRSTEAGVKYFLYGSVASSVMLYGMSLLYGATGSLQLAEIGQAFLDNPDLAPVVMPATVLALVGLGFKASLAPFYQWAPDTYEGAPTPITAYLSTASKAVGLAVIARIFLVALGAYRVEWVPVLAGLSILTMTLGNLVALRQTNVKRMLAYSSVAQAGYILMGLVAVVSSAQADVTALSINGLNGLLIYLFAYLFTNVGAFMVVQAVEEFAGSTDIQAFDNLARRAPGLAWAMFIFLLSLTGIPLTGGFIGKFYVFGAAIQHQYFWLAAIGLVNAGVAAFYYLNVVRAMFFAAEPETAPTPMPVAISVQIILLICVGATLWIGIYPPDIINWANNASQYLLTIPF
ncbi:NADH-quinone oxidoreductase subunit N [Litorilinea aerophila]|uniref:NADH-quinone oxidoreductase subunit N n=1 Tax=Litorilinea aerophila TaxID=1204385 RepID=A0A540VAP6_9CHLR|nr:NADH-quinone oxidoreductase subunit N [Litorilinea aerophila]MCC9078332.1 NADH-quinone oxidoreductase subunit N [Litorilinea aerophila]GIV77124.1 MAG: NADH-quinone oxidoreductase subunit N [Litorilinea sp.]